MTTGRPGGHGHRTREHVVIVGGPSYTFNGYGHWHQSETYHAEPRPADTSPANIKKYLQGDPAHVVPGDPILEPTSTHDYYWANFLYSAVKLVELRGRVPEAITPAMGDLLTFMVWLPSYQGAVIAGQRIDRQFVDWQASPYNSALHHGSAYVNARPYDPAFRRTDQNTSPPRPQTPPAKVSTSHAPPVYSSAESDINHEILMRTTGEVDASGNPMPDGGFPKRMHDPDAYVDAMTDLPIRICYGSKFGQCPPVLDVPPLLGVYVKVLFVRDQGSLFDYLNKGTWTGDRRLALTELVDEDHMLRGDIADCTWAGQGFMKKGTKTPLWDTAPSVTRPKCKIRRLDYVGHSAPEALFLEYGIENSKGAEPEASVLISEDDLVANLDGAAPAPASGLVDIVALKHGPATDGPLPDQVTGLAVDTWVQTVPADSRDTAVAFHYDEPRTDPPQAILVAVAADLSPDRDPATWSLGSLVDVVTSTMALSRQRAVAADLVDDAAVRIGRRP